MWSRREFLATSAAATFAGPVFGQGRAVSHRLRLATGTGAFERTVGCRVADQVRYAAEQGFAAFVDPQLLQRSEDDVHAIRLAAGGCRIALGPVDGPAFHRPDDFRVRPREVPHAASLTEPFSEAQRCGISAVRCPVGPAILQVPDDELTLWSIAATTSLNVGQRLFLDPWDDGRAGRAVFERCVAVIRWLDEPGVQLSLNADLVRTTGGSVAEFIAQHAAMIGQVELQSLTGHEDVIATLQRVEYTGLVTLTRSLDGPSLERRGRV